MSNDRSYDRRTILRTVGAGTVGGAFAGMGMASARGENGNRGGNAVGPCTCGECPEGTFCGKIDDAPQADETYTFSANGESFSVTVESVTKKEDEVVCFEFSSADTIEKVCVKGGDDTETYTGDLSGELCAPENQGGQQAEISNVSFCGAPATHYQIDLVTGSPICNLGGEGSTYGGDRLIQVLAVRADGTVTQMNTNTGTVDSSCVAEIGSALSFDVDTQSASVSFDVEESAGCTLSLVGYHLPAGCEKFDDCSEEPQTLLACETDTFSGGETGETLSIDLDDGDCSSCE